MKRKIGLSFLSLLAVLCLYLLFLHYPEWLLAKQFSYGPFTVYSNQEITLDEDAQQALDSVLILVKKSAFYRPDLKHKIFLARGSWYETLNQFYGQMAFAFSFSDRQIYLAELDLPRGIFHRNHNEYELRQVIQLMAHETVHNQQAAEYSVRYTPVWINEGYAEYVSHEPIRNRPDYNFWQVVDEVKKHEGEYWLRSDYGYWDIWAYKYYRVLMEYLLDHQGMTIQMILEEKETLVPEEIFAEMLVQLQKQ